MLARRALSFAAVGVCLLGSLAAGAATRLHDDGEALLPRASAERPRVSYEYWQIPFASVSHVNGALKARWDESQYAIEEAAIAADLVPVQPYAPGRTSSLVIDEGKRRYDVIGWMTDRSSGDRVRFITPLWTRPELETVNTSDANQPYACSLQETITCADGSTVSVSCSGDTGTCVSCSTGSTACCRATRGKTDQFGLGRVQKIVIITEEQVSCPPTPQPSPGPVTRRLWR